jgi:hypothetical protein
MALVLSRDVSRGFLDEAYLERFKVTLAFAMDLFERLHGRADEIAVDLNFLLPESQCGRPNLCVHVLS